MGIMLHCASAEGISAPGPNLEMCHLQGIEALRRVIGAGHDTARTPKDLVSFDPASRDLDYEYHVALGYSQPRLL